MVKGVVGEETRLKLAEDRLSQSGLTSQVGLVIGKLSSPLDRGFVFDLVPTPPNDASEPACSLIGTTREENRKGSKSKSQSVDSSSLVVDKDWVAEHARQVSRMLVGGMKVIGVYIWISDPAFKNSTIMLCQTVKGVAEAAPISATDWDERLLIHICYSPRRWTCRNCLLSLNITSSSLRPCDFKMGRVLASVRTFKCMHNFNLRLDTICDEADEDQPPADDASIQASKERSSRKPVSQLSLNSLRKTCTIPFPRRVFVPWLENTFICDYLQPSETLEVLKDHCVELMSMEAPTDASTVLEPEVEVTSLKAKSFWDVAIPFSSSRKLSLEKGIVDPTISESSKKAGKSTSINVIATVFSLFLSVLDSCFLKDRSLPRKLL